MRECDVISGFDMTVEAALTKLSYVLGKDEWTLETKKQVNLFRVFAHFNWNIQNNIIHNHMGSIYYRLDDGTKH